MTQLCRSFGVLSVLALILMPARVSADPLTFRTRISFTAAFSTTLVDDYSNPGYRDGDVTNSSYLDVHTDAHMSSVLGETRYQSTGRPASNIVFGQPDYPMYCAGCNGSFLLTFDSTSIGDAGGVLGVGFDFSNSQQYLLYGATVTFGDGSVRSYALPYATTGYARDTPGFFGIASPQRISSIHFGLDQGRRVDTSGSFAIDNLTLGGGTLAPVPEPATLLLVGSGLGLAARLRRRR
jgi:hypothetical protein